MSAVSQSYPNYLGGLNEQPDELKKPGQLVEALNVIPDPTIGLVRRPGFELVSQLPGTNPKGTWFELELELGGVHFGCVNPDGSIRIFDESGQPKTVKYVNRPIPAHRRYLYDGTTFTIYNNNDDEIEDTYEPHDNVIEYFAHSQDSPLKYCISKNNLVFTNPAVVPQLNNAVSVSDSDQRRYYSFISLKLIDRANYNYTFKRFYGNLDGSQDIVQFNSIKTIACEEAIDIDRDYDKDTSNPWNGYEIDLDLEPNDPKAKEQEDAKVKVTFRTKLVQLKSSDGDGYRNEYRLDGEPDVEIITSGKGFKKGEIREKIDGLNGGPDVTLVLNISETRKVTSVDFDEVALSDSNSNDAESILADLADGFKAVGIDKVLIVGNGIYLENNQPFSVSTSEIAVADVMNSQRLQDEETNEFLDKVPIVRVNSVAELPVECYDGFIVEIVNSFDNLDNYYLEYVSESAQDLPTTDVVVDTKADGFWKEIAKPYEKINPKNGTLPHIITAVKETDDKYAFIVSKLGYPVRTAGSARDNPSFFKDEAKISSVNYYKNRLFFFTEVGTVVSSRAGEIGNLFLNTSTNISIIDPIDVIANSNQKVPIHGSAIVNNGLVLFGDTEQYSLSTSNDLLSSETVNVTKISNYTYDKLSNPIYLGANLGFVSSGVSRFYEMTNVYDRGPVDINERSQQIQTQFGQDFNMPVSSREQSIVLVYKYGASSTDMMIYRFRQESSQESSQSSWVRWRVDTKVAYASLPKDNVYLITQSGTSCKLYKMSGDSLTNTDNPTLAGGVPKFTDGYTSNSDGVKFTTNIVLPTIYAGDGKKSDVTANLTIHRVKLSTSLIGAYRLEIKRRGYDTYDLLVEQTPADEYNANFPPLYGEKVETVPVYTRNKNLTLTIYSDFDAPLTLRSMTWEGDYNRPYYKSV